MTSAMPHEHAIPSMPLLRGSFEIGGFFFDAKELGVRECRRRALELWEADCTVYTFPEGIVFFFAAERRADCSAAPGWPLRSVGGRWSSATATAGELIERSVPSSGVCVERADGPLVLLPSAQSKADPSEWLDLSGFCVAELLDTGAEASDPEAPAEEEVKPVHELLKADNLAPVPEIEEWLKVVETSQRQFSFSRLGRSAVGVVSGVAAGGVKIAMSLLARAVSVMSGRGRGEGTGSLEDAEPGRTGWVTRAMNAVGQAMLLGGLAAVVGRRFASYIKDLLGRIDTGDLDEFLRRAIPLDGGQGGGGLPTESLSWLPAMFAALFRGFDAGRTSTTIPAATRRRLVRMPFLTLNLHEVLRRRYLEVHERLDREGRWKEAAFVLAQLLNDIEGAVAYLEKHEMFREAAELAEGRKARPAIVVRAWFLAGEVDRATDYAIRNNCLSEAIALLEKDRKGDAERLRIVFAERLAEAGQYEAAMQLVRHIKRARDLYIHYLDLLIALGGDTASRMLTLRLADTRGRFDEVRPAVEEIARTEGSWGDRQRRLFADALKGMPPFAEARLSFRILHDAFLRQVAEPDARLTTSSLKYFELVSDSMDNRLLRHDTPSLMEHLPMIEEEMIDLLSISEPLRVSIDRRGSSATVLDAVRVGRGNWLVALGEGGVRLVDRHGRRIASFGLPATELIPSMSNVHGTSPVQRGGSAGAHVLTVARRGNMVSVGRIDVARRREDVWPPMLLERWSPVYDGIFWAVSYGQKVSLLRITPSGKPETCWQKEYKDGRIFGVLNQGWVITVLLGMEDGLYVDRVNMPLTREELRKPGKDAPSDLRRLRMKVEECYGIRRIAFTPDYFLFTYREAETRARGNGLRGITSNEIDLYSEAYGKTLGPAGAEPLEPCVGERWLVMPFLFEGDVYIYLVDRDPRFLNQPRVWFHLKEATGVRVRFSSATDLVIADESGRILEYSLEKNGLEETARIDLRA